MTALGLVVMFGGFGAAAKADTYEDPFLQPLSPADGASFRGPDVVPFAFRARACCYDRDAFYEIVVSAKPDVDEDGFLDTRWQTGSLTTETDGYYTNPPTVTRLHLEDEDAQLGDLVTWTGTGNERDFGADVSYQNDGPPLSIPKPADDAYYWQIVVSDFSGVRHSPVRRLTYRFEPPLPKMTPRRAKKLARKGLLRQRPTARDITTSCFRLSRTKASCVIDWLQGRKSYIGTSRVAYVVDSGQVAWAAKLRNVKRM